MNKKIVNLYNSDKINSLNSGLTEDTISQIKEVFSNHSRVISAILYGSRAKGNYKVGSDIDLTLIGTNLSLEELLEIQSELEELPIPYKFDLSLYQQLENPDLIEHIKRVGKFFYQKES